MFVESTFAHGSQAVGTTPVQLVTTAFRCLHGLKAKAGETNSGTIYIGASSGVTAGTAATTDGYPLAAGEELTVPVSDPSRVYLVASDVDQIVYFTMS